VKYLERLDNAWNNPNIGVFSLIAAGGVGKTTLAYEWQFKLKEGFPHTTCRRFSFYAQGSEGGSQGDAESFFIEAFNSWFPEVDRPRSRWEQGRVIAQQIRDSAMAVVLDGLEPLQRANDPNRGSFLDERMISLFQELALPSKGLCVCTSRVPLVDLNAQLGHGHLTKELDNLSSLEGATLFREIYNIAGTHEQLVQASDSLGNHALALTLTAKYIAEYYPSDRHIHRLDTIPSLASMQVDKESRHVCRILRYYENIFSDDGLELALLKCLGLFDRPAEPKALEVLWSPAPIAGLSESLGRLSHNDILRALRKLSSLGLVNRQFSFHEMSAPLDCHPIIRAHFAKVLRSHSDAWRAANLRLSRYYASLPSVQQPKSIEEMQYLFPAVVHACRANAFAEAWDIYWRRIQQGDPEFYNTNTLCAFHENLAALNAFYKLEWKGVLNGVEDQLGEGDYWRLLTEVGFHLKVLGRFDEAKVVIRAAMEIFDKEGRFEEAAKNAENLSECDLLNGNLRSALTSVAFGRNGQSFADMSGDPFRRLQTLALRGQIHLYMGHLDLAKDDLLMSEELRKKHCSDRKPVRSLYLLDYYAETSNFGELEDAADCFRPLLNEVAAKPFTGAFYLFTGQGKAVQVMQAGKRQYIENALDLLEAAVRLLDAADLPHLKPWVRCVRAKLWVFLGVLDRAKVDLETAMNIARYSRLRLFEAECHLGYCNYYVASGETNLARQHIEEARPAITQGSYGRKHAWLKCMERTLNNSRA
jgi:tetratricopeptide (TPR) repeat protein